MDITKFIVDFRESAFLLGDYNTYRGQLARRLRIVRKKLGRATAKNAKFVAKAPVTAEEVAKDIEYAHLSKVASYCTNKVLGTFTSSSLPPSEHGRMQWP
jgi:signal recognition particle subunit SRP68